MKRSVKIISLITVIIASLFVIGHFMFNFPQETSDLSFAVLIAGIGIITSILVEIRIRRLSKIILLITSILALFFVIAGVTKEDISFLINAVLIMGIGIFNSILINGKEIRSIKIVLSVTSILTGLLALAFVTRQDLDVLQFITLIIGMGVGVLSTLVEKRNKTLFYGSVIITIVGWGIISVYQGYIHPTPLDERYVPWNLGSFYAFCIGLFFHNTYIAFGSLLGGPTIIYPYLQLSTNVAENFPRYIAGVVAFYGYKGIILALGWLNVYPEVAATFLACMAGIRVALESFQAVIHIRKDGFFDCLRRIKNAMVLEIINTMPKVVALLLIAAVLETLWTQFWVNYWLQHIL